MDLIISNSLQTTHAGQPFLQIVSDLYLGRMQYMAPDSYSRLYMAWQPRAMFNLVVPMGYCEVYMPKRIRITALRCELVPPIRVKMLT